MNNIIDIIEEPYCYEKYIVPYLQKLPLLSCLAKMIDVTNIEDIRSTSDGHPLYHIVDLQDKGAFYIFPNPKFHHPCYDFDLTDKSQFAFLGYWIHPQWSHNEWKTKIKIFADINRGPSKITPIDTPFNPSFSNVTKPVNYFHTYRDFKTPEHLEILKQIRLQSEIFFKKRFGLNLDGKELKAFFHYPCGPVFNTVHIHFRTTVVDPIEANIDSTRVKFLDEFIEELEQHLKDRTQPSKTLHYKCNVDSPTLKQYKMIMPFIEENSLIHFY